jgi:hypothetical protein
MFDCCPGCHHGPPATAADLCSLCRDDLRFVVRPQAHREQYRRNLASKRSELEELQGRGVLVMFGLPADNSEWICDLCNARIPVFGEHTLIPMMGDYALCTDCATAFPFWPDGWTQPSPRACRCGACQRPLLQALAAV